MGANSIAMLRRGLERVEQDNWIGRSVKSDQPLHKKVLGWAAVIAAGYSEGGNTNPLNKKREDVTVDTKEFAIFILTLGDAEDRTFRYNARDPGNEARALQAALSSAASDGYKVKPSAVARFLDRSIDTLVLSR